MIGFCLIKQRQPIFTLPSVSTVGGELNFFLPSPGGMLLMGELERFDVVIY